MTDATILDRPPRTYEGACADLIAKGARQERERIVAKLLAQAEAEIISPTARFGLIAVANFIRSGGV